MLESENLKMTRKRNVIEENHRIELEKVKKGYDNEKEYYKNAVKELRSKYKDLNSTADGLIRENEKLQDLSSEATTKEQRNKEMIENFHKQKSTILKNIQKIEEENVKLNKSFEESNVKKNDLTEKNAKWEKTHEEILRSWKEIIKGEDAFKNVTKPGKALYGSII